MINTHEEEIHIEPMNLVESKEKTVEILEANANGEIGGQRFEVATRFTNN